MDKNNSDRQVTYMFLAGHQLNADRELTLEIKPDEKNKVQLDSIRISVDEYEGIYNQDRLCLLVNGELKNGIELSKKSLKETKEQEDKGKRYFLINGKGASLTFKRTPFLLHPVVLHIQRPKTLESGNRIMYHIGQKNTQGELVGGLTIIFEGK